MKKNLIRLGLVAAMLLIVFVFSAPKASADEIAHYRGRYYGPQPVVHRHYPPQYYRGYNRPYAAPYRHYYKPRPVVVVPYRAPYVRPVIGVYF